MCAEPGDAELAALLASDQRWHLELAWRCANLIVARPGQVKLLVRLLFSPVPELRRHAADTARRLTERHAALLEPFADQLLGALAQSAGDDWRMLAHTGLVCARVARTRADQLRAAGLLRPMLQDPSNVVRCTAIESLALLASRLPELQREVLLVLEEAAVCGTPGMRSRARVALGRFREPAVESVSLGRGKTRSSMRQ